MRSSSNTSKHTKFSRRFGFLSTTLGAALLCGSALIPNGNLNAGEKKPAQTPGAFDKSTIQFDFASGLLGRKLYTEAVDEFARFIKDYPQDARMATAVFRKGESLFALEKYAEASRDFYEYLTKYTSSPNQELARLRYGCCLFQLGKHKQVISTLEPLAVAGKSKSYSLPANYYLGRSLQALKQLPKAASALEQVKSGELAPLAMFALGEIKSELGKHAEAASAFATLATDYAEHELAFAALLRQGEELRIAGKLPEAAAVFVELTGKAKDEQQRHRVEYGLAWVRQTQGDFAAARSLAQKAATSNDENIKNGALYLDGICALKMKAPAEAAKAFEQVGTGVFMQTACRQRAWALLYAKSPEKALQAVADFRKRFAGKADSPEMGYIEGKAHALRQDWEKATAAFGKVRQQKTDYHQEAAYELAYCLFSKKDYQKAADAFGYFSTNFPKNPLAMESLTRQGKALLLIKKYEAALPVYARILATKGASPKMRLTALSQQALCYYWLKQYANMVSCYRKILEEAPQSDAAPEALYWTAWYEYSEKRFDRSVALYERLLTNFPKNELATKARYRRAMSLYQGGKEEKAADAFYTIITKYPEIQTDQQEMLWLGSFFMKNKEFSKADFVYEALLKRNPTRNLRAVVLYYQAEVKRLGKDWDGALQKYQRLLAEEKSGLESPGNFGLAICLREKGKLQESKAAFDKVSLNPEDPMVMNYLYEFGILKMQLGDFSAAAANLMRVGLLYDDEQISADALLKAGECYLSEQKKLVKKAEENAKKTGTPLLAEDKNNIGMDMVHKARVSFEELAGSRPGSFGKKHPKSPLVIEGKKRLDQLLAKMAMLGWKDR